MYCCCQSLPGISVSCCFYWNLFGMFYLLMFFFFCSACFLSCCGLATHCHCTFHPFPLYTSFRYKKLMIMFPAAGQETGGTINAAESSWHLNTGRTKKKAWKQSPGIIDYKLSRRLYHSSASPYRASFSHCQVSELVLLFTQVNFINTEALSTASLGWQSMGRHPPHQYTPKSKDLNRLNWLKGFLAGADLYLLWFLWIWNFKKKKKKETALCFFFLFNE